MTESKPIKFRVTVRTRDLLDRYRRKYPDMTVAEVVRNFVCTSPVMHGPNLAALLDPNGRGSNAPMISVRFTQEELDRLDVWKGQLPLRTYLAATLGQQLYKWGGAR